MIPFICISLGCWTVCSRVRERIMRVAVVMEIRWVLDIKSGMLESGMYGD